MLRELSPSLPQPDVLVLLHVASAGDQDEDAGCDEEPVVLITAKLLFLSSCSRDGQDQADTELQLFICPKSANDAVCIDTNTRSLERNDAFVTKECHLATGLTQECLQFQPDLAASLGLLDAWFDKHQLVPLGTAPQNDQRTFVFVTDGPNVMRLVLHPNLTNYGVDDFGTRRWLLQFIDIRKVFAEFFISSSQNLGKLVEICTQLQLTGPYLPPVLAKKLCCWLSVESISQLTRSLPPEQTARPAVWPLEHCRDLARIAQRLSSLGAQWTQIETIQEYYQPAIINRLMAVNDETVVRARGLPWQATDMDVHKFFRGISIAPGGIALVLGKVGRRNGEALIMTANREQRDLALRRHKHHMGQRYIEVYAAVGCEFMNVACAETNEAEQFIQQLDSPWQTVVRIRGLPYDAGKQDILDFFDNAGCPVQFGEDSVLFVKRKDGKATGDAFVIFKDGETAEKALLSHRQHIGSRYIELFKSTPAEVNQVMNAVHNQLSSSAFLRTDPNCPLTMLPMPIYSSPSLLTAEPTSNTSLPPPPPPPPQPPSMPCIPTQLMNSILSYGTTAATTLPVESSPAMLLQSNMNLLFNNVNAEMDPQLAGVMRGKHFVKIRGMPRRATVDDMLTFLDVFCAFIAPQGIHFVKSSNGESSGEAVIEMINEKSARGLAEAKCGQLLQTQCDGASLVEIVCCGAEETAQFAAITKKEMPLVAQANMQPVPLHSLNLLQQRTPPAFGQPVPDVYDLWLDLTQTTAAMNCGTQLMPGQAQPTMASYPAFSMPPMMLLPVRADGHPLE